MKTNNLQNGGGKSETITEEIFREFYGLGTFLKKSLRHLQNIKNESVLCIVQKVGNDMATVLISAFCSALHSNDSSLAKLILFCELTKLGTPNVWNVNTMSPGTCLQVNILVRCTRSQSCQT